jgi:hypothetical protein
MQWRQVDEARLEGSDFLPAWPQPQVGENQRLGSKQQLYTVLFTSSNGTCTYSTTDFNQFQQFKIGSKWTLKINGFGELVSVEPTQ